MYLIAGATGHVGSVVARELLAKGKPVKVIVRDAQKGAAWSKAGAEVAVGELADGAFLAGALKGATGFFTLMPPIYTPDLYEVQRRTAEAVAAAVQQAGVKHVVLLSSLGADRATDNGPIKGLHHFENALRASGTTLTAIRACSFQENVGNSLGAARNAGIYPAFFPPDFATGMIATKDIGALAARTLLAPPARSEVVDLVGPEYTGRQIAQKLGAALGKTLQIVEIPQPGWVGAMVQGGVPPHTAESLAEMFRGGAAGYLVPKGDRLERGKTELDETLRAIVA